MQDGHWTRNGLARVVAGVTALAWLTGVSSCQSGAPAGAGATVTLALDATRPGTAWPFDWREFTRAAVAEGACAPDADDATAAFACLQVGEIAERLNDPRELQTLVIPRSNDPWGNYGMVSLRFPQPRCVDSRRVWGIRYRIALSVDEVAAGSCDPRQDPGCGWFRFALRDSDAADIVRDEAVEPWIDEVALFDVLSRGETAPLPRPTARDESADDPHPGDRTRETDAAVEPGSPLGGRGDGRWRTLQREVAFADLTLPGWDDGRVNDRVLRPSATARLEFVVALRHRADALTVRLRILDLHWIFRAGAATEPGPFCTAAAGGTR